MAVEIKDDNFGQLIESFNGVALVDFWATWCGPCQVMLPIIEDLSKEIGERARIGKVNVDENPKTAEKFGIMSIPTLIIFKDGKEITRFSGVQAKETLKEEIEKLL